MATQSDAMVPKPQQHNVKMIPPLQPAAFPPRSNRRNPQSGVNNTEKTNKSMWIDASDTQTMAHVNNSVSQMSNKSGKNARLTQTQATTGRQPMTNTRLMNNSNAPDLRFNQFLRCNTNLSAPANGDFVVFCVADLSNNDGIRQKSNRGQNLLHPWHFQSSHQSILSPKWSKHWLNNCNAMKMLKHSNKQRTTQTINNAVKTLSFQKSDQNLLACALSSRASMPNSMINC